MLDAAESLQELRVPPSNRLGILDEPAQSSYDWSPRKTVWAHASRPRSIPSEKPGRMVASSICLFRLGSAALFAPGNPIARDPNRVDAMHILDIDQWIVREDD